MSSIEYSIKELTAIVQGKLFEGTLKQNKINDILIDSRRLISPKQCAFFALVSKHNDGHKYVDELYKKGIRYFVVSKLPPALNIYSKAHFILVDNTLLALQQLCAFRRKQMDYPVIGITGSNGKTIVKEWLYQLMQDDKNIIRSPKSYNSQIGVPLSIWQMNKSHEIGIFEAGISEPNEMEKLQVIIQPTIGIYTNVGHAHDEGFINQEQKAGEKLKLFTKVKPLIYCLDHSIIQGAIIRSGILENVNPFTWSTKINADLFISNIEKKTTQTKINGKYQGKEIGIEIPFTDNASIENAIHCWTTMLYLNYDINTIASRMKKLSPIAMRLELKEGINNCSIINDSYNSDINSIRIALDFFSLQKQHKKKTLILSDILQSSINDVDLYSYINTLLETTHVQKFIGIGPSICEQTERFTVEKYFYKSTRDFLDKHPFASFNNESILIKGARIFEFEQISNALQQKDHETVLEIDFNSICHNFNFYRSMLKNSKTKIMAMVKAFSYGSGSFEIANLLQFHNIDYLSVAYSDEGVELRKAGIRTPIMVMNPDTQGFDAMIKHNLEFEIYSFRILDLLEKAILRNIIPDNKPVKIHIKLDTGMHRLGFDETELDELIQRIKRNKSLYIQSIFSHLAASDNPACDNFTLLQIERFKRMSKKIVSKVNDHPILLHILNSAGINRFPYAQFDMVRLGISLYGIATNPDDKNSLKNVATLKSNISQIKQVNANETIGYNQRGKTIKKTTIAIIPIGYADGLNRLLGNGNGHLLIHGKLAPLIGDICMDMCMIDITNIPAKEGDEVIIFGKEHPITEMAKNLHTIPYEILTGISRRVKRVYFQE